MNYYKENSIFMDFFWQANGLDDKDKKKGEGSECILGLS